MGSTRHTLALGAIGVSAAAVMLGGFPPGVSAAAKSGHPAITKLSVSHGSTLGGTRVTISGHGFKHVTSVRFGSSPAHVLRVASTTKVVVTTPRHPSGWVDVRVRAAGGVTVPVKSGRFQFVPPAVQIVLGNSGGQTFGCSRNAIGALQCWGGNSQGELGDGTTKTRSKPVRVHGMASGVRSVSAGAQFTCAVTATHGAKCWGWEYQGRLGNSVDDINGHRSEPVNVSGLTSGVSSVTAATNNACAVTAGGAVKCWGANNSGQLGTNTTDSASAVPVTIAGLSDVSSVGVGANFACALTKAGAVKCWGANSSGQLGRGGAADAGTPTPAAVHGLDSGVRSLSVSGLDACAVTSRGAVKCWGSNSKGQLGVGGVAGGYSTVPQRVHGMASGQRSVALDDNASACAVSSGGAAKCWGYNYDGQLGNGTDIDSTVPVKVLGLSKGVKTVSMSTYTGCALITKGKVKCWGYVPVAPFISYRPVGIPWFQ